VAPINTWYKNINKQIKQVKIQLLNGQKNSWNNLRLVWFNKNNFNQEVNEQSENLQLNANTKGSGEDEEINIYHKLNKVLNLKKTDTKLQEKIQKIFLLPSECYELFVIPIFNKNKASHPKLNLKTYSIDNLDNLEYDENYQHSTLSTQINSSDKKASSKTNLKSKTGITKKSSSSNLYSSKENEEEVTNGGDYSKHVLNKLPNEYYKSIMNKHKGHCLVHQILSDKNLEYYDKENGSKSDIVSSFGDYEDTTEDDERCKNTEGGDINAMVRNDFYKWLKETNNIQQVQRLLNYKKENE